MNEVNLESAKAELRNRIRLKIKRISAAARAEASAQACARLKQQAVWRKAERILLFAPLPDEPDIWPLLSDALAAGKTVALPRFSAAAQTYAAARVQNLQSDLRTGQFGIREPRDGCADMPLSEFDLVLAPGVAFDLRGRRLGRGRGFYDRLLTGVRGVICGVAFDEQVVEEVPAGSQDIRVNCLLTPTRWLEIRP
jgi:5-formyltetrahydrofolate cyclo-ligase